MELRNLRYFVAVAEELHFGRAAVRLNMAQPPLSFQIKRLETELGVQLFYRTKRRVTLTDAGETFLEQARLILRQVERATNLALMAECGQIGEVRLAFCDPALLVGIGDALAAFREEHRGVRLHLNQMTTLDEIAGLGRSTIDLAVGLLGPRLEHDVAATVLHTSSVMTAMAPDHPLACEREIRLDQLINEPLIVFPHQREYGFYEELVRLCDEAGFTPRLLEEANGTVPALGLVAAGYGIALMLEVTARLQYPGVVSARSRRLRLRWR
jgi:DNA-binding transcriptional LysR family regulator